MLFVVQCPSGRKAFLLDMEVFFFKFLLQYETEILIINRLYILKIFSLLRRKCQIYNHHSIHVDFSCKLSQLTALNMHVQSNLYTTVSHGQASKIVSTATRHAGQVT